MAGCSPRPPAGRSSQRSLLRHGDPLIPCRLRHWCCSVGVFGGTSCPCPWPCRYCPLLLVENWRRQEEGDAASSQIVSLWNTFSGGSLGTIYRPFEGFGQTGIFWLTTLLHWKSNWTETRNGNSISCPYPTPAAESPMQLYQELFFKYFHSCLQKYLCILTHKTSLDFNQMTVQEKGFEVIKDFAIFPSNI